MRRVLIGGALVLAVAVGVFLFTPATTPPPSVRVVQAQPVPEQTLCREYGKATLAMADDLDRAFAKHARAHRDYKAGKITQEQVFEIWGATLHDGRLHSGHYRELSKAWRKGCLADT